MAARSRATSTACPMPWSPVRKPPGTSFEANEVLRRLGRDIQLDRVAHRIERPHEPHHPPRGAERGIVRLDGQPGLLQAQGHGVEHRVAVAGEAQGREIVGLAGTHDQALAPVVDPVAQAAVAIGRGLGQAQHVAAEAVPAFRVLDVENQVAKGEAGRH